MRKVGLLICIIGSIAVILFPPFKILGELNWGFIFDNIVNIKGFGGAVKVYDHIDYQTLIIELLIVNAVGLVLFFSQKKKKKRKRR